MSANHLKNTHAGGAGILSVGRDHLLTVLGVAICSLVHLKTYLTSVGEDRTCIAGNTVFNTVSVLERIYFDL